VIGDRDRKWRSPLPMKPSFPLLATLSLLHFLPPGNLAADRLLLHDPLTSAQPVTGESRKHAQGGVFSEHGWRATRNGEFLMIELAAPEGFEGRLEIDVTELDWARANTAAGMDKVQFLGMFSNPRAELHVEDGGSNSDALWSLRGGTAPDGGPAYGNRFGVLKASRGAKRAEPSDFEESVAPMSPGWAWNQPRYTFRITWSKTAGELRGYVNDVLMFHEPWAHQVTPLRYLYIAKGPDFHTFIGPVFSNLRLYGPENSGPAGNQTPTITLLQPLNGAQVPAGGGFELSAEVDDDGTVARVEFFAGEEKLGETTQPPHRINVTSLPTGWYALTAKATDTLGAASTSRPKFLTVGQPWQPWGLNRP